MKFYPQPSSEEFVVLIISSVLGYKGFKDKTNCSRVLSFSSLPFSWRISHIIYPLPIDLGLLSVDHAGHYSSACLIGHLPKPSVRCSNQDSIVQGSFPH